MNDEPRSNLRPALLIGGGAALGVIALCTIVILGAAGLFVWLSTPRGNSSQQATQAAIARQPTVEATIDNTPLPTRATPNAAASPTGLPLASTPGGITTLVNIGTQSIGSIATQSTGGGAAQDRGDRPPAKEAVRAYYDLVGDEHYDVTWPMLTDAFKQKYNCCSPNYNFTGYVQWWDSVDRVEVGNVRTVSQNQNRAVVYAEIAYVMNDGNRSSPNGSYFNLVYDDAMGMWRFDDIGNNP